MFCHKNHANVIKLFECFQDDYEVLSINYQRVFSNSSWSSGFELVRRVFSYATDRQNIKTQKKLLRWERIKSGKDFPLKTFLIFFRKKIVTILVVDISLCQGIFPVFLYFSNSFFFNYWHIALMQKNRQMNSLFWRHVREIRKVEMTGN